MMLLRCMAANAARTKIASRLVILFCKSIDPAQHKARKTDIYPLGLAVQCGKVDVEHDPYRSVILIFAGRGSSSDDALSATSSPSSSKVCRCLQDRFFVH